MPAPAGAMTTVSGHHRLPCAISLVIRGRGTTQPGTPGAVILAATIGTPADTAGLPAAGRHLPGHTDRHPDLRHSLPAQRPSGRWAGRSQVGLPVGCHARRPWRAPRPHSHEMPARQAGHHAVGMKSEIPAAQIHAILSRSPEGRPHRARACWPLPRCHSHCSPISAPDTLATASSSFSSGAASPPVMCLFAVLDLIHGFGKHEAADHSGGTIGA